MYGGPGNVLHDVPVELDSGYDAGNDVVCCVTVVEDEEFGGGAPFGFGDRDGVT
jgi:hypothetical protein